jgi:predicted RNA-binding Zn-ribbon protein involved in translation (DUF1610 family)
MEKYYRVSDVKEIIKKLAKEPAYYHDGEDFYNGVCAVEGELMCLEPVMLEEPKVGEWLVADILREDADRLKWSSYSCSECGYTTDAYYNDLRDISKFCPNCGAKMIKE